MQDWTGEITAGKLEENGTGRQLEMIIKLDQGKIKLHTYIAIIQTEI